MPELLNLIEMRTGLSFNFIEISDSRDLTTRMKRGDVTIAAPLIWSQQRSRDFDDHTVYVHAGSAGDQHGRAGCAAKTRRAGT